MIKWTIKIIICFLLGYGGMYFILGEVEKKTTRVLYNVGGDKVIEVVKGTEIYKTGKEKKK